MPYSHSPLDDAEEAKRLAFWKDAYERDEEQVYLPDPNSVTHEVISEDEWLKVVAPHYPEEYPDYKPGENIYANIDRCTYPTISDTLLAQWRQKRRHNAWYRRLWRWVREWWVMDE